MPLPDYLEAGLRQNIADSMEVARQGYQPYQGHRFAPENTHEAEAARLAHRTHSYLPYLRRAAHMAELGAETFPQHAQAYMNPYQQAVLDRIAHQGNRNLTENILPELEARFVRLGQHGGRRHADLSRRAARDIQSEISGRQAEAAHQGFGQAMQGFNADQARRMAASQQQVDVGQMTNAGRLADIQALMQQGTYGREQAERPFEAAQREHHMMQMDPRERQMFLSSVLRGAPYSTLFQNPPVAQSMHRRDYQNLGLGMGMRGLAGMFGGG